MADDEILDGRNFRTHSEFVDALSHQLWRRIQAISQRTGLSPQNVCNRMIIGMYVEAKRLKKEREARN